MSRCSPQGESGQKTKIREKYRFPMQRIGFYIVKKGYFVRFDRMVDLAGNARVKCLTLMRRAIRLFGKLLYPNKHGGSFDAHELC